MNSILFESVGVISKTQFANNEIGAQIDTLSEGVRPTYGVTSDDMDFVNFQMSVTYA